MSRQLQARTTGPAKGDVGTNVVIIEDHLAIRKGLELLLRENGLSVVGTSDRAEGAAELIRRRRPDVVVLDVVLPGESGVGLARRLLEENPLLGVLLYTGTTDSAQLAQALDCGARGVALKAGPPMELIEAVRTLAAGGDYLDPKLRSAASRPSAERSHLLTRREREVLDLLAQGLTGEIIADRLFLSPETVRTHVRNAMQRLQARTRVHAVVIALAKGEIGPGAPAANRQIPGMQ